jgi:hypothetical protein
MGIAKALRCVGLATGNGLKVTRVAVLQIANKLLGDTACAENTPANFF